MHKILSLEELVERLIANCMEALDSGKLKVTVTDLIRMREWQKELGTEQRANAEATWVDGWD
jgi:hypothetical protein